MDHYQVQYWVLSTGEWAYVKDIKVVAGDLRILFDPSERLSLDQAEARRGQLSRTHENWKFRVNKIID